MVITIPTGSTGPVVLTDPGFLRGSGMVFNKSSTLIKTTRHTQGKISDYAAAKASSLPVTVTFAPRSLEYFLTEILLGLSVTGSANQWGSLTTR